MGLYTHFDVGSTFSGDLQLDSKGDIRLANSYNTQLAIANYWLRTDHGDYAASLDVGCNLGEFIGGQNTEKTLDEMRDQAYDILVKNVFFPEDIAVQTAPIDVHEALVAVQIRGEYMNISGEFEQPTPQVISYVFPYIDGQAFPTSP